VEELPSWRPLVVACDMSTFTKPDEVTLDTLARLQLAARRLGATIRIHNACPLLVDLIEIAGLADVLVVVESGVEVEGETEQREELWVDEEVLRGDGAV
jgi:hypothetical protein